MRNIEEKVDKGSYIAPKEVPTFPKIADEWVNTKKPNIRHSTYEQHKGHIGIHLKPYYGETKVSKINYDSVEKFIQHCREQEVSIPTLRKLLVTLGAIMTYASRKRYIDHNPVRDVEKPRGQSTHGEGKEIEILMPEQIRALLDAATDLKYKTLFMTAIMTGVRQGELLGLKWDDIDWVGNQIHVKRTFNHRRFYEPKTTTSRRKIDLASQLIAQLKEWQLACPPNKLNLIFPNAENKAIDASNLINRVFLPTLKKAKIPKVNFHSLRHTYASLLIDQEESPKYIQAQMGHSSINVTFDIYGHLMKDANQEAATRLGNAIFEADGSKMVADTKKGAKQNA